MVDWKKYRSYVIRMNVITIEPLLVVKKKTNPNG